MPISKFSEERTKWKSFKEIKDWAKENDYIVLLKNSTTLVLRHNSTRINIKYQKFRKNILMN